MPRAPINFAQGARWAVSPFPDGDALAARFGFREDFPLGERLEAAGALYLGFAGRRFATPRERRERLDQVAKEARAVKAGRADRAAALALLLLRAPGGLSALALHVEHCFDRAPAMPGARAELPVVFSADQLVAVLAEVKRQRQSLRRMPKRGIPGDGGERILIRELGVIWQEGTGRRPTASTHWDTAERSGPFVDFLLEIAGRVGIEKTGRALWKLHDRWKE